MRHFGVIFKQCASTGDKLPAVDRAISLGEDSLVNDLQGFSSDLNAVIFFECRRPRAAKEHHLLTPSQTLASAAPGTSLVGKVPSLNSP